MSCHPLEPRVEAIHLLPRVSHARSLHPLTPLATTDGPFSPRTSQARPPARSRTSRAPGERRPAHRRTRRARHLRDAPSSVRERGVERLPARRREPRHADEAKLAIHRREHVRCAAPRTRRASLFPRAPRAHAGQALTDDRLREDTDGEPPPGPFMANARAMSANCDDADPLVRRSAAPRATKASLAPLPRGREARGDPAKPRSRSRAHAPRRPRPSRYRQLPSVPCVAQAVPIEGDTVPVIVAAPLRVFSRMRPAPPPPPPPPSS
jgi:hypothetical protein